MGGDRFDWFFWLSIFFTIYFLRFISIAVVKELDLLCAGLQIKMLGL